MRRRGFSLIEVLIVVIVAAMAIAAAIAATRYWSKESRWHRATADATRTIGRLSDAVIRYGQAHPEGFDATPREVPLTELVSAGSWPASAPTATPWGQPLAVLARKGTNGIEAIVMETRVQPDPGMMLALGIDEVPRIEELKRTVAVQLAREQRAAGVVTTGATRVDGALGTFRKDVADFATADTLPASWAAIAVLSGFTELTPETAEDGIDIDLPTTGSIDLTGCTLVQPRVGRPAACSSGMREVARWPYCGARNPNFPPYVAYPSDTGTVTVGLRREDASGDKFICKANDFWPTFCSRRRDQKLVEELQVHGGTFGGGVCETIRYGHQAVDGNGNVIPPGGCNTAVEGAQFGLLCETRTQPDDIYAMGADSVNLLCCAE